MSTTNVTQFVIIRADANEATGTGHLVRSFALAKELLSAGIRVQVQGHWASRLRTEFSDFGDVEIRECSFASETDFSTCTPSAVIFDGYHFGSTHFAACIERGIPYAVVDDVGADTGPGPLLVVNQNPNANRTMYPNVEPDRLFLGLRYAMIRPEVWEISRPQLRDSSLLVNFGGSDPLNLTFPVASHLASKGHEMVVTVGAGALDASKVKKSLRDVAGVSVADSRRLPEALTRSRLGILAAGSTLWEANLLGCPVVAVVVADNQEGPARAAMVQGLVLGVVDARKTTDVARRIEKVVDSFLLNCREQAAIPALVDGHGSRRIASELVYRLKKKSKA